MVLLREAGTNRRGGLGTSPFFLRLLPFFVSFCFLVANALYSLLLLFFSLSFLLSLYFYGFIVPCHFQRKRIVIILGRCGMVTYDALLSVNYLLIILFILAATMPPSLSTKPSQAGQRDCLLKILDQKKSKPQVGRGMFASCSGNIILEFSPITETVDRSAVKLESTAGEDEKTSDEKISFQLTR